MGWTLRLDQSRGLVRDPAHAGDHVGVAGPGSAEFARGETDHRVRASADGLRHLAADHESREAGAVGPDSIRLDGEVRVKTYRDVLDDYRTHPEGKSLGPDGEPCNRHGRTAGTPPRDVSTTTYIGKESNHLEDTRAGLVHNIDEILNEYPDPGRNPFDQLVRSVLRGLSVKQIAAETGLSERVVEKARAGASIHKTTREKLTEYTARYAQARLREAGIKPPRDPHTALAAYVDQPGTTRPSSERGASPRRCLLPGCEQPLTGRQRKWCSDAHRQQAGRTLGASSSGRQLGSRRRAPAQHPLP